MAGCPQIECFTTNPQNEWLKTFRQQTNAVYALKDGGNWMKRERTNDIVNIISDPKSIDPRVPESMDFTQKNYRSKKRKDFLERTKSKKIAFNGGVATLKNGNLYDADDTEHKKRNVFRGQIPDYMKIFPEYNAQFYNLAELLYRYEERFDLPHSFTEKSLKRFFEYYKGGLTDVEAILEAKPLVEVISRLYKTLLTEDKDALLSTEASEKLVENLRAIAEYVVYLPETELPELEFPKKGESKSAGVIPSPGISAVLSLLPDEFRESVALEMDVLAETQYDTIIKDKTLYSKPLTYYNKEGIQNDTASNITVVGDIRNIWNNPMQLRPQTEQGYEAVGPHTDITEMAPRRRFGPVEPEAPKP